jgi:hypothetical protein
MFVKLNEIEAIIVALVIWGIGLGGATLPHITIKCNQRGRCDHDYRF